MLSLFPEILFLAPFSAFLLRIALAVIFAYAAWQHISERSVAARILSVVEIAVAAAIFAGSWTQAGAIVGFALASAWLLYPSWNIYPRSTVLLVLVMCVSLLVTGAGAFAFDLPL